MLNKFVFRYALFAVILTQFTSIESRPTEEERVRQWYAKGNTWPPQWQSEAESYNAAMRAREEEIMRIPGSNERWENWVQHTQALMVPKFTELGFEVIQIPDDIFAKLKKTVDDRLSDWDNIRLENQIDVVYTPLPSKFIDIGPLSSEVMEKVRPLHEQWAGGIELAGTSAYGIRMYQNGSTLAFHHDRTSTHVISSIIHIAHEYYDENDPWPIEIIDHNGNMHAVNLEPGQMLFYESAKCVHGRRKRFNGKYYASIFVHYKPVDRSIWSYTVEDVIANVPPFWQENIIEDKGSRWAGSSITVDSLATENAPPRMVLGEVVEDMQAYIDNYFGQHDDINEEEPHDEL
eukprot:gene11470-15363_t